MTGKPKKRILIKAFVIAAMSVIAFWGLYLNRYIESDIWRMLLYLFILVTYAVLVSVIVSMNGNNEKENVDGAKELKRLVHYTKKRAELEDKISKLTSNLTRSDIGEYIDMQRLAYLGQGNYSSAIDVSAFLGQYGIDIKKAEIRKGTAAFLTPFDDDGMKVFMKCRNTMADIGFLLIRTDNYVAKEDILANIVTIIVQSELILVNVNSRNANVYYELGIAHTLGKETVLIGNTEYPEEDVGFDVRQKRILLYQNLDELEKKLLQYMQTRKADNYST